MTFAGRAKDLQLVPSAEGFVAKGKVSAGGAISAFVDYFAAVAKGLGIEMNECAIAVTKVMLHVLSSIALADRSFGVWAAALHLLSLKADVTDMKKVCFGAV